MEYICVYKKCEYLGLANRHFESIAILLHGYFMTYTVEAKTLFAYKRDSQQGNLQENQTEAIQVDPYGYVLTDEERCNDFREIRDVFTSCQNGDLPDPITVAFILDTLKAFCREKTLIQTCIVGKFQKCANIDSIKSLLDESFSFCNGKNIPYDLESLLTVNYKAKLPNDGCMDVVLQRIYYGQCDYSTRPRRKWNGTLQDRATYYQRNPTAGLKITNIKTECPFLKTGKQCLPVPKNGKIIKKRAQHIYFTRNNYRKYEWYIDCVLESDNDMDEYIPACSMTRRDTFAILVAGVQVFKGVGMNSYSLFEYFMNGGKKMSPLMADLEFYP